MIKEDQLERSASKKIQEDFNENYNAKVETLLSSGPINFVSLFSEEGLRNEYILETHLGSLDMSGGGQEREMKPIEKEKEKWEFQPIAEAAIRVVLGLCPLFFLSASHEECQSV